MEQMKKILPILLTLSLFSCISEKKRQKICATCPTKTEVKDSIVETIREIYYNVYVHDTIETVLPNPCAELCEKGKLKKGFKETFNEGNGITTTLKEDHGKLDVITNLNGFKTNVIIRDTSKQVFHSEVKDVPANCNKEHRNWIDHFCSWFTLITLSIIGIYLLIKFLPWRKLLP